jgi:hypothetical protein
MPAFVRKFELRELYVPPAPGIERIDWTLVPINTTTLNHTVTFSPVPQEGDYIVFAAVDSTEAGINWAAIGATEIAAIRCNYGTPIPTFRVATLLCGASPPSSYNIALITGNHVFDDCTLGILYRGVDPVTPLDGVAPTSRFNNTVAPFAAGLTTLTNGAMVVALAGSTDTINDLTEADFTALDFDAPTDRQKGGERIFVTAGATGDINFGAGADESGAVLLALRPGAAPSQVQFVGIQSAFTSGNDPVVTTPTGALDDTLVAVTAAYDINFVDPRPNVNGAVPFVADFGLAGFTPHFNNNSSNGQAFTRRADGTEDANYAMVWPNRNTYGGFGAIVRTTKARLQATNNGYYEYTAGHRIPAHTVDTDGSLAVFTSIGYNSQINSVPLTSAGWTQRVNLDSGFFQVFTKPVNAGTYTEVTVTTDTSGACMLVILEPDDTLSIVNKFNGDVGSTATSSDRAATNVNCGSVRTGAVLIVTQLGVINANVWDAPIKASGTATIGTVTEIATDGWTPGVWTGRVTCWRIPVISGGTLVLETDDGTGPSYGWFTVVDEVLGYDPTTPIAGVFSDSWNADGAPADSNVGATPNVDDVLYAAMAWDVDTGAKTLTPGTGWTERYESSSAAHYTFGSVNTKTGTTSPVVDWPSITGYGGAVYYSGGVAFIIKKAT